LKVRAPKIIRPSLVLCWALHMVVNVFIPMYVTCVWDGRNLTRIHDYGYCAGVNPGKVKATLNSVILVSTDVMCLGLMLWASGSMVFILFRHKQRIQHIRRSPSLRTSPEARATQSILTLVSSFVLFYTTSAVLALCLASSDGVSRWLVNTNVAMSACFPAFCPFLLTSYYTTRSRLCSSCLCQALNYPGIVRYH
jgi:vomeronasal1 receptor